MRCRVFGLVCFALAAAYTGPVAAGPGDVFFVDRANTSGVEDGAAWGTAFSTLQAGIDAAWRAFGGEVWVAQGLYDETRENGGALLLRPGVSVYGGFRGNEASRNRRDPDGLPTIIDGSAANGGAPAAVVVFGANNALLDGVTIQGGRAFAGGVGTSGAGLVNVGVSPTLRNCIFIDNSAERFGGAVLNVGVGVPRFEGCVFLGNRAGESGGAVANTEASPEFIDCRFEDNVAGTAGGAMLNTPGSNPLLSGCVFVNNSAGGGGGAIFNERGSPLIERSKFLRNRCAEYGGAIFNNDGARPLVVNSLFVGNRAGDRNFGSANPLSRGGAITNLDATVTVINSTFSRNEARSGGGALFNSGSNTTLINCIVWDNLPNEFSNIRGTAVVRHSNVMGGAQGEGNINYNPRFVDPDDFESGYALQPQSRSIDAGTFAGAPDSDIDGIPRPQGAAVDMGAYEAVEIGAPEPMSCEGVTIVVGKRSPPIPAGDLLVQGLLVGLLWAAARRRR